MESMKKFFLLLFLGIVLSTNAQKDSLDLGDKYWEDQLYLAITYNTLLNRSEGFPSSGFSYGLSLGYIKDIPFNRRGNWAAGIGLGYSYDSFNHGLRIDNSKNITLNSDVNSGKIRLHTIEMPIQIRWRTSDAVTYSFWRIYTGVKLSYNFDNTFKYQADNTEYLFNSVASYNKFQVGLELSAGYGAFNFYVYYGLIPMHNVTINEAKIDAKVARFGLVFYFL